MSTSDDERWMLLALQEAAKASGRTSPNPLVGAVVVRNGVCVGTGFHPRAGQPHAEVFALREAGEKARGATVYVTLEPCSHYGRTPPCADKLIAAGVARVVSAMEDPDARVSGRGHAKLRHAGIAVESGVLESEARRLNAPYLKWKRTGRPFVTVKLAMSLDGKTATRTGESKWITSEAARAEGHRLRNTHDAILTGIGTILADDPQLTTRLSEGEDARDALRVILDTHARTPVIARALQGADDTQTILVVGEQADAARVEALESAGAVVWRLPSSGRGIDLNALLDRLGSADILSVLVEGGASIIGSFVEARAVDRVVAFLAPMVIGGREALSGIGGEGFARLAETLRFASWETRPIPPDLCVIADVE
ncbi:MAG: bifunctional diaminohydroxyphosphoribosylaminopyrimidine deaminase/5-amino-6-(5-phosphoribosylamino)uracil reductase RibD [Candidatus Poribacteria bacterium]|nr:bifunctional diaminohydroxyphosphoribosylaminopyrimidine deaminase/5-amino-6-(5-phosphoribosylamino)uracil reductase RibD [Candidatus Poribacteria bacterium]